MSRFYDSLCICRELELYIIRACVEEYDDDDDDNDSSADTFNDNEKFPKNRSSFESSQRTCNAVKPAVSSLSRPQTLSQRCKLDDGFDSVS